MRLVSFLVLVALLVVIISSSFYIFLKSMNTLEVREIPTRIEINNFVGIDLSNDTLAFGTIFPGGRARRNLTITSGFDQDVLVRIRVDGIMEDWMYGYERSFFLGPYEERGFSFVTEPPEETPIGPYNSTVIISFHKT